MTSGLVLEIWTERKIEVMCSKENDIVLKENQEWRKSLLLGKFVHIQVIRQKRKKAQDWLYSLDMLGY